MPDNGTNADDTVTIIALPGYRWFACSGFEMDADGNARSYDFDIKTGKKINIKAFVLGERRGRNA